MQNSEPDSPAQLGALSALIRSRAMCRSFLSTEIDGAIVDEIIDLGTRAPSAGRSQGLHIVELTGGDRERLWGHSLPAQRRAAFAFPGLLHAPVLLVIFVDPDAYVERYSEPDKAHTSLGEGKERWNTPFWFVDAGMAVMSMLLAAEAHSLGALFFALPEPEDQIRSELGIPTALETVGVLALGLADGEDPRARGSGRSATRARRSVNDVTHRGRW